MNYFLYYMHKKHRVLSLPVNQSWVMKPLLKCFQEAKDGDISYSSSSSQLLCYRQWKNLLVRSQGPRFTAITICRAKNTETKESLIVFVRLISGAGDYAWTTSQEAIGQFRASHREPYCYCSKLKSSGSEMHFSPTGEKIAISKQSYLQRDN